MQSVILHLDMNSYFASCEQQKNPAWRGRPLGVCEHLGGIIIAASVDAKKIGIKTGTPVWEAKKIFPKIILTKTSPEYYRETTRKIIRLVSDYTNKVEVYSIDEVFMDITRVCNIRCKIEDVRYEKNILNYKSYILNYASPLEEAVKIGKEIKLRMKKEVGDYLACSIGIAENKLLAKIASDMKKPDGLTVIMNDDLRIMNCDILKNQTDIQIFYKNKLYNHLKLVDIPGIGRRMEKRLNILGIKTLNDLKNYPESFLVSLWGIPGKHLHDLGQLKSGEAAFGAKPAALAMRGGEYLGEGQDIKSMGHMYTLPKSFRTRRFLEPVLMKLCEMVSKRLWKKNLCGKVVFCFARDEKRGSFHSSRRLPLPIWETRDIFGVCLDILVKTGLFAAGGGRQAKKISKYPNSNFKINQRENELDLRMVGVSVGMLGQKAGQMSLFGKEEKLTRLSHAIHKVNAKHGDFCVSRALSFEAAEVFGDSVGFGRVKEL